MITEKWAHLDAAMVASSRKTIKELFAEDPDRAGKFTLEAAGWMLDYSKNRIDREVMKELFALARESNLEAEIERMFTGEKINATENRAVLHTALRNCEKDAKVMMMRIDPTDPAGAGRPQCRRMPRGYSPPAPWGQRSCFDKTA